MTMDKHKLKWCVSNIGNIPDLSFYNQNRGKGEALWVTWNYTLYRSKVRIRPFGDRWYRVEIPRGDDYGLVS